MSTQISKTRQIPIRLPIHLDKWLKERARKRLIADPDLRKPGITTDITNILQAAYEGETKSK